MRKLVCESLEEVFEAKTPKTPAEKQVKRVKRQGGEVKDMSKNEKIDQAISALKKQLADANKPGAFKSTVEKRAKIKQLEDKISAWKEKKTK